MKKPKGNKSTKGSITRKDKSPSEGGKRSSTKPSIPTQVYTREQLKKRYLDADKYLDSFPAPKTLNRDKVKGYDLNQGVNYDKMMANLKYTGFQATQLGQAIDRVN